MISFICTELVEGRGSHSEQGRSWASGDLSVDQKMPVSSALACATPTTNQQPKPNAEHKSAVSAKSYGWWDDEVVGQAFLLLLIWKIKFDPPIHYSLSIGDRGSLESNRLCCCGFVVAFWSRITVKSAPSTLDLAIFYGVFIGRSLHSKNGRPQISCDGTDETVQPRRLQGQDRCPKSEL